MPQLKFLLGACFALFAFACSSAIAIDNSAAVHGPFADAAWTAAAFFHSDQRAPLVANDLWVRISTGGASCQDQESCVGLVGIDIHIAIPTTDSSGNPTTAAPIAPGTFPVAASGTTATFDYFGLDANCSILPPGTDVASSGTVALTAATNTSGGTVAGAFDVVLSLEGFHLTGSFTTPLCGLVAE